MTARTRPRSDSGPSTAKSLATHQRFVDEALRLFGTQGYEQTSMAQIAAAAGGSRANLYLYFKSKPQIVMARMREIETDVAQFFSSLDGMTDHTCDSMRRWLERARSLWLHYGTEFTAISQAMAADPDVLDEWLGMVRRVSSSQTALYQDCHTEDERLNREVHMVTLMMSLERNFYFLYIRGHSEREDRVLASLAQQWAQLFGE